MVDAEVRKFYFPEVTMVIFSFLASEPAFQPLVGEAEEKAAQIARSVVGRLPTLRRAALFVYDHPEVEEVVVNLHDEGRWYAEGLRDPGISPNDDPLYGFKIVVSRSFTPLVSEEMARMIALGLVKEIEGEELQLGLVVVDLGELICETWDGEEVIKPFNPEDLR
jgi:hypothetical protein